MHAAGVHRYLLYERARKFVSFVGANEREKLIKRDV